MKMIKNCMKIGLFLLGILVILTNCEKEEPLTSITEQNDLVKPNFAKRPTNNENELIENAKLWFEQHQNLNNFNILQYTETIDWEYAFVSKSDIDEQYVIEIPITLNEKINVTHKSNKKVRTFNRLLIIPLKEKGNYISYIVNFLKTNNSNNFRNNSPKMNYFKVPISFDGFITAFNTQNEIVEYNEYIKGNIKSKGTQNNKTTFANKYEQHLYVCVYFGYWYEDGSFEIITELGCSQYGGTNGGGGGTPPDPNYGGYGTNTTITTGCPEGYVEGPDYGCILEIVKIIDSLTGKAKCVYKKMVDNNNNINWILENFKDGDKPSEFNLIFQMSTTLGSLTNASTVKIGNTFIIKINSNRAENINTTLTIARTIIHEGIHARLREFASREGSNEVSFPGVYEYYREYNKNWDHQQMADHYRSTISEGLKQFDNAQHTDKFYEALAWEGLSEIKDANGIQNIIFTEAWKELSSTEQYQILQIITDEKENGNKTCIE